MNDEIRDNRRVALVERLLATHDLLADAFGEDVAPETHTALARRVSADAAEMYLTAAAELLGIPFLRSVVVAKSKLRGREIEEPTAQFLEQCLTISNLATQSAGPWSSPAVPAERRRYLFLGLAGLHASLVQTIAIAFNDAALQDAAADLEARAKALADEIGPLPEEAA